MIKLLGRLPRNPVLACSGGPDSMAALDFLVLGKKSVTVAYFDHGTKHGAEAREFLQDYCSENSLNIKIESIAGSKPSDESWEEWWRNERYEFLNSIPGTKITAHHLNDVAEWWIFTSLNGYPRLIPYQNGSVIRPFLATRRQTLESWCTRKSVPFVLDPSNEDNRFARAKIRNKIMSHALDINPGFLTVLEKRVREEHIRLRGGEF